MTLLALLSLALAASPAAMGAPNDPDVDPPAGIPNRPPGVAQKVNLAARAKQSTLRWSTTRDQYSSSYVNPTSWMLEVNGCASSGGTDAAGYPIRIRSYEWRAEPLDGQAGAAVATDDDCTSRLRLARLGRWRTHLTITTAANRRLHSQQDRSFRDVLIVAFGDSYVSGEGNPDKNRVIDFDDDRIEPPRWTDYQCHRSASSWAMRTAESFETSSTTVTFLNYACSGAKVRDLYSGGYRGIQPQRGDERLPAQLVAARQALGNPLSVGTRPVHAGLISAGVNDAAFASILTDCAKINSGVAVDPLFGDPCDRAGNTRFVRNAIAGLSSSYSRLEVALSEHLKGGAVRLVEYPSRVLTDARDRHGGCGIFEGIDSDEAHWITDRGDELNAMLAATAERFGWGYVGGIRDAFRRHGYCAGDQTYFRSFSGSDKLQGNALGTAHPLRAGHASVGSLVAPTLPVEAPALNEVVRLRFEFMRVRVDDPPREGIEKVRWTGKIRPQFGISWERLRGVPADERRNIALGKWVEVPPADRVTTIDTLGKTVGLDAFVTLPALKIDDPDAPKGFLTTGLRHLSRFVLHRRADGWSPGTHTLVARGQNSQLQLEYRLHVLPADAGIQTRP